ncbi:MAG TPA: hypothetical protein VGZ00_09225 [Candidatus Baltobacteraceae bacterium]|jgi:predicted GH43/DUF377 family glycosyl hydrolase|nr:hypothetical protein [Candidatus Baltobacteraceae bacterium]
MIDVAKIAEFETRVTRLGIVVEPSGDPHEIEGVLNPGSARTRDEKLLLYPRFVAEGNVSRVGIVEADADRRVFRRMGLALEPQEVFELHNPPRGYGCEDPRVTFIPVLDAYVMAYVAFGPPGPRIALALSPDGYRWERLGLVDFSGAGIVEGDDKDAAFFPDPVISPAGVRSLAFYHRPLMRLSKMAYYQPLPEAVLALPPRERESIRIAYVPLDAVLADRKALLSARESVLVVEPAETWGQLKTGAGTPPVAIEEGWLSVYHAVDSLASPGEKLVRWYSAGIIIHDRERPHILRYRSPKPILEPETADELRGTADNVVFPTAIDRVPGDPARTFEIYYGMADSRIGRARLELGGSTLAPSDVN